MSEAKPLTEEEIKFMRERDAIAPCQTIRLPDGRWPEIANWLATIDALRAENARLRDALKTIDTMPVDGCSPSVIESMLRQAKSLAYAAIKENTRG